MNESLDFHAALGDLAQAVNETDKVRVAEVTNNINRYLDNLKRAALAFSRVPERA